MLTMKKIQTRGRVETIPENPIMIFAIDGGGLQHKVKLAHYPRPESF